MTKKKEALRLEAMELALQTLLSFNMDSDCPNIEQIFFEFADSRETEPGAFAWKIVQAVINNRIALKEGLKTLSPEWLLEKLRNEEQILLEITFACIFIIKMPPQIAMGLAMRLLKRKARENAFQNLYSLSFIPVPDEKSLANACALSVSPQENMQKDGYAWDIVRGVLKNEKVLDNLITRFSHNWRLERMGRIERALLRLYLYELIRAPAKSKEIAGEAVEMAAKFGLENASKFIGAIVDACGNALQIGEKPELNCE